MKRLLLFRAVLLGVGGLLVVSGCGNLPPLPTAQSLDGGSSGTLVDGAVDSSDEVAGSPAVDAPVTAPIDAPATAPIDASAMRPVDASRDTIIDASVVDAPSVLVCPPGYADCNGDDRDGCETATNTPEHCGGCKNACAAVANGTATCVDDKCTVKCTASYDDCDGKYENGCETVLTTPEHCGGCKSACGAVANGSPACVDGKCAVKCNAPYQDCDGKYENGCEIPVGQDNSCNRTGLASFSGDSPPCGTPYCGSAAASNVVTNFGSWYCSFCDHCYIFDAGASWCLYKSPYNGNFTGGSSGGSHCTPEKCGCIADAGQQPRQLCPQQ